MCDHFQGKKGQCFAYMSSIPRFHWWIATGLMSSSESSPQHV